MHGCSGETGDFIMDDSIVVLRTFANELAAEIARAVLDAHHIPALVLRDDAGGMYPSLTFVHGVRLAVRRDDVEEALAVLDAVEDESAAWNADEDAIDDGSPEWRGDEEDEENDG